MLLLAPQGGQGGLAIFRYLEVGSVDPLFAFECIAVLPPSVLLMVMMRTAVHGDYDGNDNDDKGGSGVLRTGSMENLSKSPTPIIGQFGVILTITRQSKRLVIFETL